MGIQLNIELVKNILIIVNVFLYFLFNVTGVEKFGISKKVSSNEKNQWIGISNVSLSTGNISKLLQICFYVA